MSAPPVSCPACRSENPPENRFCGACGARLEPGAARAYTPRHLADKILVSRSALVGERKQVTVLFVDIQDSAALSESVGLERWHAVLDGFFGLLAECIHRYEGTINQFTGDGVMALFGAPVAHEDHARRACWAALDIAAALPGLSTPEPLAPKTRMGMNSGEVVVGRIGDDLRMDYTAQGHTTTLAARVQAIAAPGSVYLTRETAGLIEPWFELRDLGTPPLKGVREPVRVYELGRRRPPPPPLEAARARGLSRFAGRATELAQLESALGRAQESEARVVGVAGEAGVGKSRLCLEFLERCRARGIATLAASCPAHGRAVPLLPIRELLLRLLGVADGAGADEVRSQVARSLRELDPALELLLPLALDLLGAAPPDQAPLPLDAEGLARRRTELVARVLQARARRDPLVLAIEDLHWIDRESEALLAQIVEAIGWTRTLLVVNFRPGYRAAWMDASYYVPLPLAPLDEATTAQLLRDLLGSDPGTRAVAELVRDRTGGNPFFVEEVIRDLVATGSLVGEPGDYRAPVQPFRIRIPPNVVATIEARIDRLGDAHKQLLQSAAVIGRSFDPAVLQHISGLPEPSLTDALAALCDAGFLRPETAPADSYAFEHPLTHEVAYQSQLQDARRAAHAEVARALEELHADRLGLHAALLAHHWAEAGESGEAHRWRRRAALHVSHIQTARRPTR